MKAIVWTKYGSPEGLQLREVEKPVPKEDEILVKVHAATVTAGDCEMRRLQLPLMLSLPMRVYAGFFRPKRIPILGQELSGEVVEVGKAVSAYQVGDQVFGTTGFRFGAYAEFICLAGEPNSAQGILAAKPANLTYAEAAAVPVAGLEALHFMRAAHIQSGKKVLVIGAGGSIGTYAIQLAKHFGVEVTGVDRPEKLEKLRAIGADDVIDYTQGDYTLSGEAYDLIIDVVGKSGVSRRLKLLKDGGDYFLAFASPTNLLLKIWLSLTGGKKLRTESAIQKKEDLEFLSDLIEAGQLRPVIDRELPLAQTVAAHRYAETGAKVGNIVIKFMYR
ncbi:MAG: NAD(P)-dependent alcohol dehydrogenase [Anaerolineales bacterium]